MVKRFCISLVAAWALAAGGARAQAPAAGPIPGQAEPMAPVVVTATRLPTPEHRVASTATVVERGDLRRHQHRQVHEALEAVPGVHPVPLGGAGQQTSVFIRGGNSNHTLVLIDGVEANDPTSPTAAFDFALLPVNNIERIEVVRGPQSTLYGSSALGGVINVITRPGRSGDGVDYGLEAGSDGTWNQNLRVGGEHGPANLAFGLVHLESEGDSVTPNRFRSASREDDGSEQWSGALRAGLGLGEGLRGRLFARFVEADTELDEFLAEDPDRTLTQRRLVLRGELDAAFLGGRWDAQLAVSRTRFDRHDRDPRAGRLDNAIDTRFDGASLKHEWVNHLDLGRDHSVTVGLETRKESFTGAGRQVFGSSFGDFVITEASDAEARTDAVYGLYRFTGGENFDASLGVRRDDHEDFAAETTVRFAPVYRVPGLGLRLFASAGTGFRAPSLFELHGFSPTSQGTAYRGNPDLEPERSSGFDAGFEKSTGPWHYGVTAFRSEVEGLIQRVFLPTFDSTSANVDEARIEGAEVFAAGPLGDATRLRMDYTFTDAVDGNNDRLVRRPRHQVDLDLTWRPAPRLEVSLWGQYRGGRTDVDAVGNRVEPGGYALFHLAASREVAPDTEVYARVNNLLDREYEPAYGYAGQDLGVYAGVRGRF